jgi:(2Fe-2S) ferredoxin
MPAVRRHLFVCTNGPFCWYDGDPDALLEALKKRVAAAGLKDEVRVNRSGCLNACGHGPTVVVYPEATWYGRVQVDDAEEIFQNHILRGEPVARLRLSPDFQKDTSRYPDAVQSFKRVEREIDALRHAAQDDIRKMLLDALEEVVAEAIEQSGDNAGTQPGAQGNGA